MTHADTTNGDHSAETAARPALWGDLGALAEQFTTRAAAHDSVADRLTSEDSEQALIDSGIAAGYRGAAEMALKSVLSDPAPTAARAKAIKTIAAVLDQWENGALVNNGDYEGIVWVEPLWPLPRGAEKIRDSLAVLGYGPDQGEHHENR